MRPLTPPTASEEEALERRRGGETRRERGASVRLVFACVERVERVERGLACLTPFLRSRHTLYASRKTFVALV